MRGSAGRPGSRPSRWACGMWFAKAAGYRPRREDGDRRPCKGRSERLLDRSRGRLRNRDDASRARPARRRSLKVSRARPASRGRSPPLAIESRRRQAKTRASHVATQTLLWPPRRIRRSSHRAPERARHPRRPLGAPMFPKSFASARRRKRSPCCRFATCILRV